MSRRTVVKHLKTKNKKLSWEHQEKNNILPIGQNNFNSSRFLIGSYGSCKELARHLWKKKTFSINNSIWIKNYLLDKVSIHNSIWIKIYLSRLFYLFISVLVVGDLIWWNNLEVWGGSNFGFFPGFLKK